MITNAILIVLILALIYIVAKNIFNEKENKWMRAILCAIIAFIGFLLGGNNVVDVIPAIEVYRGNTELFIERTVSGDTSIYDTTVIYKNK